MKLTFAPGLLDSMRQQAVAAFPEECCGLLAGRRDGSLFRVTQVSPSRNVTSGDPRVDFEVDPTMRIKLERALRGGDERLIGHYHSHPDGRAEPSERDLAQAYEPELVWLIIAVSGEGVGDIAAYSLSPEDGKFERLSLC